MRTPARACVNRALACGVATVLCGVLAVPAFAQPQGQTDEGHLAAEFRRERRELSEHCDALSHAVNCLTTLFTGKPIHVAVGSVAPRNGFGFGLALSTEYAPSEAWRLGWSADAVITPSGAWRAGGYMKFVHTPPPIFGVVTDPAAASVVPVGLAVRPHTVINLYAQTTSLARVDFYGLGPQSLQADRTSFSERATIAGVRAIVPLNRPGIVDRLSVSAIGEVNGRFTSIGHGPDGDVPSIQDVFTDADAPGLDDQPTTVQLGAGLRARPGFFSEGLRLDYQVKAQGFLASSDATFARWTVDLAHEIPIYGRSRSRLSRDTNLPNECATSPGSDCPSVSFSRDRSGAVSVRALWITSTTGDDGRVPFYFQPTIGGNDIDGASALPSYDDYRFRGPNLLLFQETFEHAVWDPVGVWARLDHGMVALRPGGLSTRDLRTSFTLGATVRAGGFPQLAVSVSWGGGEGRHLSAMVSTSLLGGSSRPTLQ